MKEKVYLNLFILCVVLSQGISVSFLEDVGESSNVLVREKRVINRKPGKDIPVRGGEFPYIVSVRKNNRVHCVGSILSHYTAITAARCVTSDLRQYAVHSGSIIVHTGSPHNITNIKLRGHDPSRSSAFMSGIALLIVHPPFIYRQSTQKIELHDGIVLAGMKATINGWGAFLFGGPHESQIPKKLRSITVPIMKQRDCIDIYRGYFPIGDEDICTYHEKKLCGYTDAGAPLVIDNKIAGVHIGYIITGGTECPIKPDVFVYLQNSNYKQWIMDNIV